MAELDSLVLAIADDVDDRRLRLADVVVLHPRPTVAAALLDGAATLARLPGCLLVAVGVATGGCLMCRYDARWVRVDTADWSVPAVVRLAVRYYLSSVVPAVGRSPAGPGEQ